MAAQRRRAENLPRPIERPLPAPHPRAAPRAEPPRARAGARDDLDPGRSGTGAPPRPAGSSASAEACARRWRWPRRHARASWRSPH